MKKKPSAVALAQAFQVAKEAELREARTVVKTLEGELGAAISATRKAQGDEDAHLPQCKIVTVMSGGRESVFGPVVILRKTPGGMLVTRRVGEPGAKTFKFTFVGHSGKFVQAEKQSSYAYAHRELRDVPAAYMPAVEVHP